MAGEMRLGANEIRRRKSLPCGQLMINGKWRDAEDDATMPTSDPTTATAGAGPIPPQSRTCSFMALCSGASRVPRVELC
jgi:hypothetical protein